MTVKKPRRPDPPARLRAAGKALWRELHGKYGFEPHEVPVVRQVCGLADSIADLETAVAEHGTVTEGAAGQVKVNPALVELRQCRATFAKLLGSLAMPDADGVAATAAQRAGRQAADARWQPHRLAEARTQAALRGSDGPAA